LKGFSSYIRFLQDFSGLIFFAGRGCLKSHFCLNTCYLLFVLQRVNPLVPNKLQKKEPTDLPVGAQKKESVPTFETPSSKINVFCLY